MLIITFRDESEQADTEADPACCAMAYDELIYWSMACCDLAGVDVWKSTVCRGHGVGVFFEDNADVLAARGRCDAVTAAVQSRRGRPQL